MQWSDDQIDDFYSAVGGRIKEARTRSRTTQGDLAQRLGLTRSSVANIEAGRQRVQLHWLMQISSTLNISVSDLLPTAHLRPDVVEIPNIDELPDTTADFLSVAVRRAGGM